MRRLLVQPAAFLDHLEGSKCLLGLIVVVELPRQIAYRKKQKRQAGNNPKRASGFEQAICHVESFDSAQDRLHRDISNC